jgi:hypothetical protein
MAGPDSNHVQRTLTTVGRAGGEPSIRQAMTRAEHFDEAEKWLGLAANLYRKSVGDSDALLAGGLAAAIGLGHASLATAPPMIGPVYPDGR